MIESATFEAKRAQEARGAELRKDIENLKGARCSKCGGKASIVVRKANGGEMQSVIYCRRCHNDVKAQRKRIISMLNK